MCGNSVTLCVCWHQCDFEGVVAVLSCVWSQCYLVRVLAAVLLLCDCCFGRFCVIMAILIDILGVTLCV